MLISFSSFNVILIRLDLGWWAVSNGRDRNRRSTSTAASKPRRRRRRVPCCRPSPRRTRTRRVLMWRRDRRRRSTSTALQCPRPAATTWPVRASMSATRPTSTWWRGPRPDRRTTDPSSATLPLERWNAADGSSACKRRDCRSIKWPERIARGAGRLRAVPLRDEHRLRANWEVPLLRPLEGFHPLPLHPAGNNRQYLLVRPWGDCHPLILTLLRFALNSVPTGLRQ